MSRYVLLGKCDRIRINVHLPWWYRRATENNRFQSGHHFFDGLINYLLDDQSVALTVSAKAHRAQVFPEETFCVNYHTTFTRRRNLNVKGAYFHNFFYFDRKGYSGWSEIAESLFNPERIDTEEAISYYTERLFNPYFSAGISKYPQPSFTPSLPSSFVFFPMQVPNDKVLDLSFISQSEILQELTNEPKTPVVIKPHPLAFRDHRQMVEKVLDLHNPSKSIFVVNGHLHEIIRRSKVVICTNSGAGIEALLLGKPVITCGRCDYHHLTEVVKSPSEIWPAISSVTAVDEVLMKKYAFWFFGMKLVDIRDNPNEWARELLAKLVASA